MHIDLAADAVGQRNGQAAAKVLTEFLQALKEGGIGERVVVEIEPDDPEGIDGTNGILLGEQSDPRALP